MVDDATLKEALAVARGQKALTDIPEKERPAVHKVLTQKRADLACYARDQRPTRYFGQPARLRQARAV